VHCQYGLEPVETGGKAVNKLEPVGNRGKTVNKSHSI